MGEILLDANNFLNFQDTPWDSKVLSVKTNEITNIRYSNEDLLYKSIADFEKYCVIHKYLFTNTRINPDDQIIRKVLSDQGYLNTETSLLVDRVVNNFNTDDIGNLKFSLREYEIQDIEELKAISFDIFNHGRFFEDPYISEEIARTRNKNWIYDLMATSKIIVGEINTTMFGFMAFRVEGNRASLQLGGVKNNFTIYSYPFWHKFFLELIDKYEVKYISGLVSASNIRILNLYSYFGFKFSKAYFGYHKHRNIK